MNHLTLDLYPAGGLNLRRGARGAPGTDAALAVARKTARAAPPRGYHRTFLILMPILPFTAVSPPNWHTPRLRLGMPAFGCRGTAVSAAPRMQATRPAPAESPRYVCLASGTLLMATLLHALAALVPAIFRHLF